jgi:RNA polymerase sigma factor (sigma-70 family)
MDHRGDDPEWVAELYEASATRLTRWALQRFALSPADAEEIVQEAFLRLIRTTATVRSADAWLIHVTSRLALERCRSHPALDASFELRGRDAGPETRVEVHRLLATLPRKWQAILRLRYMEEMSAPEVAASLGLNPDHVRQISRRALLVLRAKLEGQPQTPASSPPPRTTHLLDEPSDSFFLTYAPLPPTLH